MPRSLFGRGQRQPRGGRAQQAGGSQVNRSLVGKKYFALQDRTVSPSVADPDLGYGALLTPGSGIWNKFTPDPGSRIQNPFF